ncbi:unnamed protein product [Brassicogethes aeneus]|uniref:Nucleoside diphosphate kinase n=1 Tax=Brassicogethes aeneus TaxID=1431903 RepID=A0A9P0BJ46_BRAAE|nr:unnamed protein product [Brassicogethes aeneus]
MVPLQLTLAILKPHVLKNPVATEKIKYVILQSEFKIVKLKTTTISLKKAQEFYGEHKGKFFYKRLLSFMTSGPSEVMIMAKRDAISHWRQLMGPTKVYKAQFEAPNSIRGMFGLSDTQNAAHGSDSPESAKREIGIFFPEFNYDKWFKEDEMHFRNNDVHFVPSLFIHQINNKTI